MFENIISIIEEHQSIIIFGHLNPDGDCFGSAVALKRSINLKYPDKKVYLAGSGLPEFFDLLLPVDDIADEIFPESLAILVDANDLPRMEESRIYNCKAFVKIDHHVDTGSFTQGPQYVDEDANSTCDILVRMFQEHDFPIDRIVANALYLGILTDSGRFQFVISFPETFDRVAFLCHHGADPKAINNLLTLTNERTLKFKGYVYSNYKKSKGGTIYIVFTKEALEKLQLDANYASSLVNLIGSIKGYPVWASFAEYEDGTVRVELRSNGPEVQPIALKIGGGGHKYAAGATLSTIKLHEIEKVVDELDLAIAEYRKELKLCGKKN